ncbi:hypothetical protein V6N11_045418 [Hibiscus sabdariffa]|uniref:Uncharacterized protein n=1 Tax=Hibiscus sabdariffa TaxID=183260 RepID=A0ABR2Q0W3_9ROSI
MSTTVPKRKKKLKAEPSQGEGTAEAPAIEEKTDQESSLASDGSKLDGEELVLKEKEKNKENKHESENDGRKSMPKTKTNLSCILRRRRRSEEVLMGLIVFACKTGFYYWWEIKTILHSRGSAKGCGNADSIPVPIQ